MPRTTIVVGLGFGDEGKGSWVDHLVREQGARYVVRFNGGAQALHHVVTADGREHGFAQFASGSFVPGTKTVLSRFMLVEPEAMLREGELIQKRGVIDPLGAAIVSENAPLIPPANRLMNRIQERFRGGARHGSCGFGIGLTQHDVETLAGDALYVRDLASGQALEKLRAATERRFREVEQYRNESTEELINQLLTIDHHYYEDLFLRWSRVVQVKSDEEIGAILRRSDSVFEGAQGVMLDQGVGFYPFCTRSNCTFQNADQLLDEAGFAGTRERVGLLRGYGTRHGAGPFVTEDPTLSVAPCHNGENPWQGGFRTGWFDGVAARYALRAVGYVDTLAITNLDRLTGIPELQIGVRYHGPDERFLYNGDLRQIPVDYPLLRERSEQLWQMTPEYTQCAGWSEFDAVAGVERYLKNLEYVLNHPVHAYSVSTGAQKVYR